MPFTVANKPAKIPNVKKAPADDVNKDDRTIKKYIDSWYESNLKDKYEDKLEAYDLDLEDIQSELNEVHRSKEIQEEQLAHLSDEAENLLLLLS